MKWLSLVAAGLIWSGVAQAQSITVNSDKMLNKDLSSYKTYGWEKSSMMSAKAGKGKMSQNKSADNSVSTRVRNAVTFAMEGRGYTMDKTNPDLVVSYRIFKEPAEFKGYTGYSTTGTIDNTEFRSAEDEATFKLEKGTLLVNLVDRKSGQVVWRGFASGLLDANTAAWREDKINEAVNLIFERYTARADKLSYSE